MLHNKGILFSIFNLFFWKKNPTQKNGNKKFIAAKPPNGVRQKTRHDNRQANSLFLINFRDIYTIT